MVDPNKLLQLSHEKSKYRRMETIKEIISDWKVYSYDLEQLKNYKNTLIEIREETRPRNIKNVSHNLLERKMKKVYELSRDSLSEEPVMEIKMKKNGYEFSDNIQYKINDFKTYEKLMQELDLIIEFANLEPEHIAILKNYFYDILIEGKEEVKTYAK